MKFKFSLQAVLEHRLTIEEKLQREYSDALARFESVRRRRRQVESDIVRWDGEIRQRQQTGLSFAQREIYEHWIDACREQITALLKDEDRQAALVEQCRQRLLKAVQDRTIMEKLRERELVAFRQEEARAEMKFFDEIAVRDYIDARRQAKDAALAERFA